jgi:hypothetical protein
MMYLLPFFNAFLLFICLNEGQILNKPYDWIKYNVFPRIPISNKVLGGCVLCTSFWMGCIEISILKSHLEINEVLSIILILCYNSVLSDILFKYLKTK